MSISPVNISDKLGKRRLTVAAALAVLALCAAACGSSSASSNPRPLPPLRRRRGSATTAAATSGSDKPVTVRLGYFPNLTHAPALVGVAQGTFAKDLAPDTLSTQTFSAGPAENQALLSGSLDIAFEGPSAALSAYSSSHGAIAIIAGAASGGAGLVTKASITSPSQLKGTTLGIAAAGEHPGRGPAYWLKTQGYTTTTSGGG